MPEMGGLEATAIIRGGEQASGGHMPIIAITAHALTGDREVFLDAGMDAYVSKPLRINDLLTAMKSVLPGAAIAAELETPGIQPARAVLDQAELLARVDGDMDLLRKLVTLFLAETPKKLTAIKAAIDSGDAARLARLAHSLKGSVGNFYSKAATAAAVRLESIARQSDLSVATCAYEDLARAIGQMTPDLKFLTTREYSVALEAIPAAKFPADGGAVVPELVV